MSRFIWLIRREIWENRAIWIAPAIVIGCLLVMLMFAKAHLGYDVGASFDNIPRDGQIRLHQFAYSMVSAIVFLVMGIISFFYCIDSLYADRADRSVLFWKSLPLSDAETVLSKFATAAVVVPLVALAGSVLAQIAVGGGLMAKLAMSGASAGLWLHPQSLAGGALMALVACVSAILWYSPLVAYLMLVSAWAPRGPFLWAVLPPVAAWVLERVVMQTAFIQNLIVARLFGMYQILDSSNDAGREEVDGLGALAERLGEIDWEGRIHDFYASPDLWLGIVAAALLLAAAMWVRRYRDETS
jgi:ABC-2 type transport system permease protein